MNLLKNDIQMFSSGWIAKTTKEVVVNDDGKVTGVTVTIITDSIKAVEGKDSYEWTGNIDTVYRTDENGEDITSEYTIVSNRHRMTKTFYENTKEKLYISFDGVSTKQSNGHIYEGLTGNATCTIEITEIGEFHIPSQRFFAFGKNKDKKQVYTKDNYIVLKQEYVLKNNGFEQIRVNFDFPDNTWTRDNTYLISGKVTYYYKNGTNEYERGVSTIIPFLETVVHSGGILNVSSNTCITINPNGYNGINQKGDITILHQEMNSVVGNKKVFELLIMKVDIEVK